MFISFTGYNRLLDCQQSAEMSSTTMDLRGKSFNKNNDKTRTRLYNRSTAVMYRRRCGGWLTATCLFKSLRSLSRKKLQTKPIAFLPKYRSHFCQNFTKKNTKQFTTVENILLAALLYQSQRDRATFCYTQYSETREVRKSRHEHECL